MSFKKKGVSDGEVEEEEEDGDGDGDEKEARRTGRSCPRAPGFTSRWIRPGDVKARTAPSDASADDQSRTDAMVALRLRCRCGGRACIGKAFAEVGDTFSAYQTPPSKHSFS